jgi:hypothetical protein
MEIGQRVKITNTGDVWEGKTGIIEYIDDNMVTVFVDFKDDKKVRQDFNIENVEPVSDETNIESDSQNFIDDEQTNEAVNTPVEELIDTNLKEHYNNKMKEAKPLMEQTEEKDKKIELLAKYLNVDPSTITASNQENTYDVEDEDAQYIVCTGDEAHDYAAEDIKEIFDESGLDAFSPNFQDWILDNAIDENYFEDAQDESNRSYVDDIADENSFTYDNRLIEELYDNNILTDDDFNKDEN